MSSGGKELTIGAYRSTDSTYPFHGYMENIRIVGDEALWTSNFNINSDVEMKYENASSYVRPDTASGMYKITGPSGNIRGKASEGYVRPTLKQFFTSTDFEEVESTQIITSDTFEDLDDWVTHNAPSGNVSASNGVAVINTTTQNSNFGIRHKGIIEGDFDFTIDYDSGSLTPYGSLLSVHVATDYLTAGTWFQARIWHNASGRDRGYAKNGSWQIVTSGGVPVSSKLRMRRIGSNIQTWGWQNSAWQNIHTINGFGTSDLYLILLANCWSNAYSTTGKFDNLNFTSGNLKIY